MAAPLALPPTGPFALAPDIATPRNTQSNCCPKHRGEGWGAQLGGDISKKLHLHARSLTVEHPVTKAVLNLVAPLPDHMQRTWDTFQWAPSDVPADPFEEDWG